MSPLTAGRAALGRVSMHRLVLVLLAALAVLAVVEAAVGAISVAPAPELLLWLAVALAASWAGGALMAAIARTPQHTPSALITGLLLFFLVTPPAAASSRPASIVLLVAGSLFAAASKHLLVVGGRHVLNPAAAGAFLVGLLPGGVAGWWVASPALLPFTAVAALLVLVRMRLLAAGALLVVLAGGLEAVGALANGSAPGEAIWLALAQTPVVFLAGFMFSEPITLPPRIGQRVAEAAVVAAALGLPFLDPVPLQVLTFVPTPAFALLLGNVLALVLARSIAARMRLAGRRQISPTATEFAFTPERALRHRAGQYLELELAHRRADARGVRRTLTIVSAPDDPTGEVRVAIRNRDPRSSFKRSLDALPLGSPVRAVSVSGAFTLPNDRAQPLLLVASGIGITPFISQLEHEGALVAAGAAPRDVLLVDRVASADDTPYLDVLERSGVRVLLVCAEADGFGDVALPDHWRVVDRLDAATLSDVLPDPARTTAYVSGSPDFVDDARRTVRSAGIRRVRTDAFAGY